MTVTFQMAQRQKVPSNTVYKSEQLKLLVPVVCFAELVQTGFLSCLCIMHAVLKMDINPKFNDPQKVI